MSSTLVRRILTAAAMTAVAAPVLALSALTTASAATGGDVVGLAAANLGKHNCETNSLGGTGYFTSCKPEAWCADFAKWVWQNTGLKVDGITPGAGSFYTYGANNGTLHTSTSYTPQTGDAVVFNYNGAGYADHVGLVSRVNGDGTIQVINGNFGNGDSTTTTVAYSYGTGRVGSSIAGQTINAFVTAVGITSPAAQFAGPETIRFADGTIKTYVVNADGNVYGMGNTTAGGPFGAWQALTTGGGFAGRPSVIQFPNGTVNVYVRTTAGTIQAAGNTATGPGTSFGAWQQVSPAGALPVTGDPQVTLSANGLLNVYAVLSDGNVNGMGQTSVNGSFGPWQPLTTGSGFVGRPSVVQFTDGTINVYARTTAGTIQAAGNTTTGAGTNFGSWQQVSPAGAMAVASDPQTILLANGTISTYAVLADGNVNGMGQASVGASFGPWQPLTTGSGFVGRPSVIQFADGTMNVYARGATGTILASGNTTTGAGTSFGPWQQVAS
ncbi:CHAP domain-containing protein [Solihabitans fulvus]|uniref:CHAP domain-containing protein n=1 Tax=Solihabitans fulvus TaxID=1892852 RepID=A0A5B2X5U3_9PSEU|nr:CHAP domain-containing protein [Solihabitans fulvus]KAA2258565.1 CHAP domain-containing protein [Solihabitans fulvus]